MMISPWDFHHFFFLPNLHPQYGGPDVWPARPKELVFVVVGGFDDPEKKKTKRLHPVRGDLFFRICQVTKKKKKKKNKGNSVLQKVFIIILIIFSTFTSSTGWRFILQENWKKLFSKKVRNKKSFLNFSKWFYNECIYVYYVYVYIYYIMMIYRKHMKMTKVVEFMSFTSHPIHSLVATIAEDSCLFFSQACRPPSPKPRSSLKKCRQNDSTHRFGFPWRWAEKQKIFEILHLWFFVKFSASDEIERGFLSQFFLAPFQKPWVGQMYP